MLLLFSAYSMPAHADILPFSSSGQWKAVSGTDGIIKVCGVNAVINGGLFGLYAASDRPGVLRLGFFKKTWQLSGSAVPTEIRFPDGTKFHFNGIGNQSSISADIPDEYVKALIHRFTSDKVAVVALAEGQEPTWNLDLSGTSPTINAMARCLAAAKIQMPPPLSEANSPNETDALQAPPHLPEQAGSGDARFANVPGSGANEQARPSTSITRLKSQAADSCNSPKDEDIEECYIELLKNYRGHPQDLLAGDARDAVTYCNNVAESNDSQFCAYLQERFKPLFNEELRERTAVTAVQRQRREAEEAKKPKLVAVTAQGAGVVPGALICPNYDTVTLMFDLYSDYWTDMRARALQGAQATLLHGDPMPAPDPRLYGCILVSAGTPMTLERGNIVPVVTVKLPDETTIRGVTMPGMLVGDEKR
jgi:hypothetical protein